MEVISRRHAFTGLLAGGVGVATGLDARAALAQAAKKIASPNVRFHGSGFFPLTSHIITGGSINLASDANDPLLLASAPGSPEKIQQTVAPGGKAALQFSKPGLYLLYDAATTRYDGKVGQVVAKHGAKQFPLPAYTVILVTERNGRGLTVTPAAISIPESSMTFEPWVVVVNAGEPITFTNNDMDLHIVMPSPEPMIMPNQLSENSPPNPGLWLERMESFAPITLKGGGGKGILTLSQPGLHHYYCPVHAVYDVTGYTFAPLKSYGGYPFIMDGMIVVQPT